VSHSFSELLLFAHSDRPSEPEVEDKRKITAPPSLQVFASDGRVYVSAVNADLQELLRQVSEVAGVRIVCADEVERRASANLPGLPVGELLRDLARAYGLALAERDGAYYVSGGGLDTAPGYWACEVREVPLHHITPESALYSLPDVLLGYVQVSPASNSLVVAGPKAMVDKVEGDLKVLDQPVWFTRLRGWVVEASGDEEDSRDLDLALAGGTTVAAASSWGHLALEVAGARPREVLARLDALQSRDVVKVRSCPSVAVANGQWGELFVGENQRFWQLAGYIQQMITAQVSAGVRIRCRPRTSGGSITMDLTLDSDSFVGFALPPRVQRRSVSSTLRVTDGDTILVGGLRSVEMQRERRTPRPGVTLPLFTAVATGMAKVKTFQDLWVLLEARARRGSVPTEAGGAGIGKISAS
jgi:type II secretory pathway component GspD/PulD (secretin)